MSTETRFGHIARATRRHDRIVLKFSPETAAKLTARSLAEVRARRVELESLPKPIFTRRGRTIGKPWSEQEDELVRALPPTAAALATGWSGCRR